MPGFGPKGSGLVKRRYMLSVMCGRSTYKLTWEEIVALYRLTLDQPAVNTRARFNVCPTTIIDTIIGQNGQRRLVPMRWGLVPSWWLKPLKELKLATFNARAETVDFRDAYAIAEAVRRPSTRCVPVKTDDQLDLQALHRVRSRLISERTAVINQIRGFLLEHGIPVRQGLRFLRQQLPEILANRIDVLSSRMIRIIENLSGDWRHLDQRIEHVTKEIEALAYGTESCRQLMTVPGIGPIIASAMVAAIGNGVAFAKGRDFAAWLGLVPKQMSTGDRTILGRISKRGNRYLRMLFMQGARVILLRPANWAKHSFGPWLTAAAKRLHHNVLATALANKLARIAWTILTQRRSYETRVIADAA
jgi:transposase